MVLLKLYDNYDIIIMVNSMNTRMSKYEHINDTNDINDLDVANMSRVSRNQNIYNSNDMSELSRFKSNSNVSVISDAPKEIDIEKIKSYIDSKEEEKEEKRKRLDIDIPNIEDTTVERQEFRTYDVNSVLEKARENKEIDYDEQRYRKINNTQYNILKNIKIKNDDKDEKEEKLNTEEKTIVDLIQDIQNTSKYVDNDVNDLFKDLISDNENTVVMAPITEDDINKQSMKETLANITMDLENIKEPVNDATQDLLIEKERLKKKYESEDTNEYTNVDTINTAKLSSIDKSFYTNSMSFSKTDFEGFEDLEKSTKSNLFAKIGIVVAIILLIITVFLILNFTMEWNIL